MIGSDSISKIIKESFLADCIPMVTIVFLGFFSVLKWQSGIIPALLGGITLAAAISFIRGYSMREIENAMGQGVKIIFPALLTIILVGFIISSWIMGGIIPAMVFYGFHMLSFNFFLPWVMILTGITALMTGTSFTSIGTIGVSLMIIGSQMGFPPNIIAGAVVSGAFLGDKMSPLSDTTNIAASLGEVDLFQHIRYMMWDTVPAFLLSLLIFERIGRRFIVSSNYTETLSFLNSLEASFHITPLLFIFPIIIILMGIKKIPSNIVLFTAVILGFLSGIIFQPFENGEILKNIMGGVKLNFQNPTLTKLFSKGGISEAGSTAVTIIFIGCIIGIIRECNLLENLLKKISSSVKSSKQLKAAVFILSLIIGISTGAQLLAIILPISLFLPLAEKLGSQNKDLTRIVESTGTVGITLVPWSVPGIFIGRTLGVEMESVLPFLVFPITLLAFSLILNVIKSKDIKKIDGGEVRYEA
ncbi:MAG: Na+/H+ antiporter NhaC family protein [Fusobacteriaceae bacterium]